MDIILTYCLSLVKRFIFFAILGCVVFFLGMTHGYSPMESLSLYTSFLIVALPCMLWFQQMTIAGIDRSRSGLAHAVSLIISSLFCAVLVISLFPIISTKTIPNLRTLSISVPIPADTLILNNGVILYDPILFIPTPDEAKTALVSGRTLFFSNVITNDTHIVFQGASSVEVPINTGYEPLNAGYYAQESAFFFLQNITRFHQYVSQLYTHYGISPNPLDSIPQLFLFCLLLTGIYLWASLIGLVIGHGQNHFGAVALLFLVGCGVSSYLVQGLGGIIYNFPAPFVGEGFVIGSATLGILIVCSWEIFSTRRKRR
ncbi:MAG: hypothetical protein ACRCY4_03915 [Brevinema sp.]